jgi:putative flippase GtrA
MEYLLSYLKTHQLQIGKFIVVGLIIFCINFASFHFSYNYIQLAYSQAASIAYIIAVVSHFCLHRAFTFDAVGQQIIPNLWKYALMLLINYLILLTMMWFIVEVTHRSPYLGIVAATMITAFISFFMMKLFVFQFTRPVDISSEVNI